MNGNVSEVMLEIHKDERLLAAFRKYSSASKEEQARYKFVRYTDTRRLDILYDDKPVSMPSKNVLVR